MNAFRIIKVFIPSFVLLIIFYFIDLSAIPLFGNVLSGYYSYLFPGLPPMNSAIEPVRVWWISFFIYFIFVINFIIANSRLKKIINNGNNITALEIIISKYRNISVITGLIPLAIGVCFLIVSFSMGPIVLYGIVISLLLKGILTLIITLFQINAYYDLKLYYLK